MRAVVCGACGAKVRADRDRCPRCQEALAAIAPPDPAIAAARSRQMRNASAGLVAIFLLALTVLWMRSDKAPRELDASVIAGTGDPLAARRQAAVPPPQAAPVVAQPTRPFMDAAASGTAAYGSGDYGSSLERYQDAVAKNPEDAESWSNLGQVLVRLNRAPEAIPAFEKAIAILPNRWAYQFNLARALGLTGNWKAAIATYQRAQTLFPDDYATTFNLGLAFHKAGNDAAAVAEYEKAIRLAPDDGSFRMALGVSLEKLGKSREAAAAYTEYLRLSPGAADADKVRSRIVQLSSPAPVAAGTSSQQQ